MTADTPGALLERVRKLLAKAEAEGVTPAEAEALTAKAAELMARYGIDRALLAAARPDTDRPAIASSTCSARGQVKAHLLSGLASAVRCACVQLPRRAGAGTRIHVFGYASDLERAEILYTSLLIQMAHGLAAAEVPARPAASGPTGAAGCSATPRPWSRGCGRPRRARPRRRGTSRSPAGAPPWSSPAVNTWCRRECQQAYPVTRRMRVTYTGTGYQDGYTEGQRADVGATRVRGTAGRALTR